MSPGAAAAKPSDEIETEIFSRYDDGFVAVHVVNPTSVDPGFTSTLISAGWQVMDTAATGACAWAGTATSSKDAT